MPVRIAARYIPYCSVGLRRQGTRIRVSRLSGRPRGDRARASNGGAGADISFEVRKAMHGKMIYFNNGFSLCPPFSRTQSHDAPRHTADT